MASAIEPTPAELVRTLRDRAGLSQRELAARAGVSHSVISRLEGGKVFPGLDFLSRVVGALGFQLMLGTAPLWKTIDEQIEAAASRSVEDAFEDAEDFIYAGGFNLLAVEDSFAAIPHRFCGLTAAALLGAPVPIAQCEVLILSDAKTMDAFDLWIGQQEATRWNDRLQMFYGVSRDPRDPGSNRWRGLPGDVLMSFADELPPATTVIYKGRQLPIVGLPHIETGDPHAARVLERMRQRLSRD
jgi:transcriptional regulator with XRE-family HTH domain